MRPIDKTRNMFLKNFYINDTWEENIERCYQFPSMGWVLESPQHFRSRISLSCWCRKSRQIWNSKGAHKKNGRKNDNEDVSKSDQE